MTLPLQTRFNNYTGNGVTTSFSYTFRAFTDTDVEVSVNDVVKTLGVDYTMTGIDVNSGGSIVFTTAPASGAAVSINSNTPIIQGTQYAEGGKFPAATHEKTLDRMVAVLQEMNESIGGVIHFPDGDPASQELPLFSDRLASYLGFDEAGEFALFRPNVDAGLGLDASMYLQKSEAATDYIAKSVISNAGQLLVGSGLHTMAVLPVGAEGDVLTVDSNLDVIWSAPSAPAAGGTSKWTGLVSATDFSTTAASTSTITMVTDQTTIIRAGTPIKFTLSGVDYYAICTAITASLLTIGGAPLTTGAGALTALSYGLIPPVVERFPVPGYWAATADTDVLKNQLNAPYIWDGPPAFLVQIRVYSRTTDTGTNKPRVNARIGATTTDYVSTSNSNAGLETAASATWYRTVVNIATAKYSVTFGSPIELKTDAYGGNDDASDLMVELVFVVA